MPRPIDEQPMERLRNIPGFIPYLKGLEFVPVHIPLITFLGFAPSADPSHQAHQEDLKPIAKLD